MAAIVFWTVILSSSGALAADGRKPFFAIAHKMNNPEFLREALQYGANAIEIDIRCSETDGIFVRHDFTDGPRRKLKQVLKEIEAVAKQDRRLALIIFDTKDACSEQSRADFGRRLLGTIRAHLKTEINVIISVSDLTKQDIVRGAAAIPGGLKRNEGVAVDQSDYHDAIARALGDIPNRAYGNGIFVVCPCPWRIVAIENTLADAIRQKKANGFRFHYVWTLARPSSMRKFIGMGVDGILVNPHSLGSLRYVLDEFSKTHRLADRTDRPFDVPNRKRY